MEIDVEMNQLARVCNLNFNLPRGDHFSLLSDTLKELSQMFSFLLSLKLSFWRHIGLVIMLNTQYFRSYRHIYFSTSKACPKPRPYLKVIEVHMCEQNNGQLMSGKVLS